MKSILQCAVALMLAMMLVACETEVLTRSANARSELDEYFGSDEGGFRTTRTTPARAARPATGSEPAATGADLGDWADSCAANLDEITGSLLAYYSTHQRLPPTLESIPQISPSGAKISLACPVSGKRYIYHPEGLKPPLFTDENGDTHDGAILILYDPEPSHQMVQHLTDGTNDYDVKKAVHLGIVLAPGNGAPNQPIQMSVEHIEPGILDMYLRHNPARNSGGTVRPVTPVW